jgi:hypothetical protein
MAAKNVLTALQVENAKPGLKPMKVTNRKGSSSRTTTGTIPLNRDVRAIQEFQYY